VQPIARHAESALCSRLAGTARLKLNVNASAISSCCTYDASVDLLTSALITRHLAYIETAIARCVDILPLHREIIARNCAAGAQ